MGPERLVESVCVCGVKLFHAGINDTAAGGGRRQFQSSPSLVDHHEFARPKQPAAVFAWPVSAFCFRHVFSVMFGLFLVFGRAE